MLERSLTSKELLCLFKCLGKAVEHEALVLTGHGV